MEPPSTATFHRKPDHSFMILVTLVYTLLLVYGTLFPLTDWDWSRGDITAFITSAFPKNASYGDVVTNLLVYIPFGLFIASILLRRFPLYSTLLGVTVIGSTLSFSLESLQLFLPNRVPSLMDLALNTAGTFIGVILAATATGRTAIGRRLLDVRRDLFHNDSLTNLGLAVLAFWALAQLTPLVPSLDIGNLRQGVSPIWKVLQAPSSFNSQQAATYMLEIAAMGLLSVMLIKRQLHAALPFIIFISAVLILKIPIVGRQLSLEALTGLAVGVVLFIAARNWNFRARAIIAGTALLLGYILSQLDSEGDPTAPLRTINWIPFQGQMSNVMGLADILIEAWPFFAITYLAAVTRNKKGLYVPIIGGFLVFALAFSLEWTQQTIPGRYPDITDAVLALFAWILPWLHPGIRNAAKSADVSISSHLPKHTAFKTRTRSFEWIATITVLIIVIGWLSLSLTTTPQLDIGKRHEHPSPEELEPVTLSNFRYIHPRLPKPSLEEIQQLRIKNPAFFRGHRNHAKNGLGKLYSATLMAYVEPGSQDLDALHQRLMDLKFSWRGHQQTKPIAVAYDWLFDQWNEEQRVQLRNKLAEGCNYQIDRIRKDTLSPYNVYLYNSPFQALVACAIALYGDDPRGEPVMAFTYDFWKNRVLPVWRQIMGNNGGWHEGGEYVGIGIGQAIYQVPAMWRKATGEDLFWTELGIRGFLYFLIYRTRPDGTHMRWGDSAYFDRNIPDRIPLAIEYADSAAYSLKGCPKPYQPTSWPWGPLTTDALCNKNTTTTLPLQRLFDGIGMIVARSGWDKDATYLTFKAGDNYWSHSHLDQGAFTLFKGGPLAIDSGLYGPKYGSDHHMNYSYQTIAHNVITITDPDDNIPIPPKKQDNPPRKIANDGGQRRVGSGWGIEAAPLNLKEWRQKRAIYHTGKIEKYYDKDNLVIAVAELTPAYTNVYSGNGTFSHRTHRVENYWRTLVYDRQNDIIIIFDNIESTDASFIKRSLIHTMEQPMRTPLGFTTQVPPHKKPDRSGGKMEVNILFPKNPNVDILGGPSAEFLVDGVNYNEQGEVWRRVKKRRVNPPEPGQWRVEISPKTAQKADRFLIALKPLAAGQPSNLLITPITTTEGIGCQINGPERSITLLFPNSKEGVIVDLTEGEVQKTLDLTVN